MLGRLALKELRETGWIAGIALLVFGSIVATGMGVGLLPWEPSGSGTLVPFVFTEFSTPFALTTAALAIVLGFRQSVGESARGTFLFLLHRPAGRARLVGTKLLVGLGLCLGCSALPILVYAGWAASPGSHPGPFEWSMTLEAWRIWAAMPLVYLGAFLSGIRPGRWHATRLLPLLATGPLVLGVVFLPWWPAAVLAAGLLAGVLLVVTILFVAESRDYS